MADTHEPSAIAIDCPRCDKAVVGEPRGYVIYANDREGPPERWTLLSCPSRHPLLVLQEAYGGGLGFDDDNPSRIFPPPDQPLSRDIPSELRDAHTEARKAFAAKAFKATVVMCGRTLEGVCQLQGIEERTLEKSLMKMQDDGLIDKRLWEWADLLRDVRNAGAHFNDEEITRQDAEDSLTFTEALLDYLYVLKKRFDDMQVRRVI